MPDPDPASPATINGWRSRIKCGMTPFLDSLKGNRHYLAIELRYKSLLKDGNGGIIP